MNHTPALDISKSAVLRTALRQILANRTERAYATLKKLTDRHLNMRQSPSDMLYHVFASALAKRLSAKVAEEMNLYLKQYEHSQIDLFNKVAGRFPFVGKTGQVANNYLALYIEGHEEVSLLDIGIGTGRQVVALLSLLETKRSLPRKLNLYAIEPMADALELAKQSVAAQCTRLGVELNFHAYPRFVENISEKEWTSLIPPAGNLLVNASFALHHIHGCEAVRGHTLQKIRALRPLAVVLSEPDSDHFEPDVTIRFENCWEHFETIFTFIDELRLSEAETIQMKLFFLREIEDIVGNREDSRFERHEKAEKWILRLGHAGFRMHTNPKAAEGLEPHPLMKVTLHKDYIGFDYRDKTLVAVICAVPEMM